MVADCFMQICFIFRFECPCGAYARRKKVQDWKDLVHSYNDALKNLATSGRYDTRDDFTVIYQPFTQNMTVPLVIVSFNTIAKVYIIIIIHFSLFVIEKISWKWLRVYE